LTDTRKICERFNDNFINVATQICRASSEYEKAISKNYLGSLSRPGIQIESPTSLEILGINGLNSESASGCDRISTRFCKRAVLFLSDIVSRSVNNCISNNVFPSCLKLARVVPVLKSGSQLVLNNYRPISILNIFSKIFEYVLHIGLQKYLDAQSVINGNQ
jgi:hypothetical protein